MFFYKPLRAPKRRARRGAGAYLNRAGTAIRSRLVVVPPDAGDAALLAALRDNLAASAALWRDLVDALTEDEAWLRP